jgi:hypothetical protein
MSESVFRRHTLIWLPLKTPVDEVNKLGLILISLHHIFELFTVYCSDLSF